MILGGNINAEDFLRLTGVFLAFVYYGTLSNLIDGLAARIARHVSTANNLGGCV